jgi:SAM-dependent methyltransferase
MADYTFGDNDTAAERLRLLAEAFAASSRPFLDRLAREPAGVALDLGCGPGHTTALLASAVRAPVTIGLDASERFVERARVQHASRGLAFAVHDLARLPFPAPPADLMYGRFIVTHLADAAAAVDAWAGAAAVRGRLALEEVVAIESDDPHFRRYYQLVDELQRGHGQRLDVGRVLAALPAGSPWRVERADEARFPVPAATAARLHALNLRTWRRDPQIAARVPAAELDALGATLDEVAAGARAAPPVQWRLAQVVYRRRDPDRVPHPPR